jgi:hypothetical protein
MASVAGAPDDKAEWWTTSGVEPQQPEADTRWIAHGERTLYESEWVRLGLVDVESGSP